MVFDKEYDKLTLPHQHHLYGEPTKKIQAVSSSFINDSSGMIIKVVT
jgi:hypothetical protein